ncbi:1-deoxy-D-xylulose-5-phosphate synthase [Bythopirellula polymerisocia]|uniref:1-deoxy-D-xylulose-5-phosphate synthase n=1 Tax=Bythopirellula polymerisocia TaxID=2528003 RepID=A0A5C6CL17_9BACT|nr:1-deoxy-D-xylulose-5-phosphate synthase [Bythopirellula polymerisocia]TWU23826.1 1-deoxy-D-xylulose-5-phosphate synthase [Bythopirellula polymerisocia]
MTPEILPTITQPSDMEKLSLPQLERLAVEIRDVLCNLIACRSAHFASNLGVVELCIALHTTFDFRRDRLIWDTGHQIYPHKLLTGRYGQFHTMRTKGGLMGYPNPAESEFDLFMTGHAGASVSTALGLASGDDLLRPDENRFSVAVIGDGAFPSGVVFEALNNARRQSDKMLVILNDNRMSICPRVGGMADYLDRLRMNPMYTGFKDEIAKILGRVPLFGDPTERFLVQLKEAAKAGLSGGMMFEDMGFRYVGPIDGHNIGLLRKYLRMAQRGEGPVLLHVVTEKGHGFKPAEDDPVLFHAPPQFEKRDERKVVLKKSTSRAFTHVAAEAIESQMRTNPNVTVLTAAMCQGNKLEKVRDAFPERFFDTGICEAHTVAFAAGQAKVGLRPVVDIYSTFLQRAYDHIFQEVALQNLPVTFMLDRGGLAGPDGPTHHGVFDLGYLRVFPNMVIMSPGDALELPAMLDFALQHDGPCAIRYPKATAVEIPRKFPAIELGRSEVLRAGTDGCLISYGPLANRCLEVANRLQNEGLDVAVINARFLKPFDTETILQTIRDCNFVVTVEEAALAGGFGSALLEAAADAGIDTSRIRRLGIPDFYVEHGERDELLADLSMDVEGILRTCREIAGNQVIHT